MKISNDCSFKIWKLNYNNNEYENINKFKDSDKLCDGLEIKDNEIILYAIETNPKSIIFYNIDKNEKIKTLNVKNLFISDTGERITKLNDDEVAVAGIKKVYLIDINNYQILHKINTDYKNYCILKLSRDLFLVGDERGTITQYKIEDKKINKESYKNYSHDNFICSMTLLNDVIISRGYKSNDIKLWKK